MSRFFAVDRAPAWLARITAAAALLLTATFTVASPVLAAGPLEEGQVLGQQAVQGGFIGTPSGVSVTPSVTMDGTKALINLAVNNPSGLKTGVIDMEANVPSGMSVVNVLGGGAVNPTDSSKVGWIIADQFFNTPQFGRAYTVETNGQAGTVTIGVTTAGGEENGTSFFTLALPGGTVTPATVPSTGGQQVLGQQAISGGVVSPPTGVTIVPAVTMNGTVATVDLGVNNPSALKPGVIDVEASLPSGMSVVNVLGGGAVNPSNSGQVGWIIADQFFNTPQFGRVVNIETNGLGGTLTVRVTTAGGEENGTSFFSIPLNAAGTSTP